MTLPPSAEPEPARLPRSVIPRPLLLMAPYLRSAQVGPAALNPYLVHPVEIAGQIALLKKAFSK